MEWAFTHADIESFGYFEPIMANHPPGFRSDSFYRPIISAKIVKKILLSFRKGEGQLIEFATQCYFNVVYDNSNSGRSIRLPEQAMATSEQDFRDKLQKQLHTLIGVMPRIDLLDGKHIIYYL